MKFKSLVFAVLFLAGFATMEAQVSKKGNMDATARADRQTEQMATQLSLSAEQKAKVKVVNEKYAKQMEELRANTEDRTQLRPKMQEMRQAQEKEVSQYLTKEQTEKWAQVKDERQGRRTQMEKGQQMEKTQMSQRPNRKAMAKKHSGLKNMTPQEKAAKRTEKMTKELGLSTEQAKKIEAIYTKSGEQKANYKGAKKEESREEMKNMREEEKKAIDAVLTKEQIAKREELKAQKKAERMERKKKMKATKLDDSDND